MRLLLDTHVLLWWMLDDRRLPRAVKSMIASPDADVGISAATMWEIAIKRSLGRITIDLGELAASVVADGFVEVPVRFQHAICLADLPRHHDDPFDRLLVAQSIVESRRLVTGDEAILGYGDTPGFDPVRV